MKIGFMKFLILFLISFVVLIVDVFAQNQETDSVQVITLSQKDQSGSTIWERSIKIGDLQFRVQYTDNKNGSDSIQILEYPHPFLLRNRSDLLPAIQVTIQKIDQYPELGEVVLVTLLPHIDSPDAILIYLTLKQKVNERITWLKESPKPDDYDETVWISSLGTEPVLKLIEQQIDETQGKDGWLFCLLARPNQPQALELLTKMINRYSEQRYHYAWYIQIGGIVSQQSWQYLLQDIIHPAIKNPPVDSSQIHDVLLFWFHLADKRFLSQFRETKEFDPQKVQNLGGEFVKMMVNHPKFDSLMGGPSAIEYLESAAGGSLTMFLMVCEQYGTKEAADLLDKKLKSLEGWQKNPEVLSYSSRWMPPPQQIIADYNKLKSKALAAMLKR